MVIVCAELHSKFGKKNPEGHGDKEVCLTIRVFFSRRVYLLRLVRYTNRKKLLQHSRFGAVGSDSDKRTKQKDLHLDFLVHLLL